MKRQLIDPVFIMSSERSGSNLLRTLLDNHSKLYGPRAPQLMKTFEGILPYYAALDDPLPMAKLFGDMKEVLNHKFHDWKVAGDCEEIAPAAESFFDLWPMPSAKFIYLYRDPRDVAASWMKVPLGFKNVNEAAVHWSKEQTKCLKVIKSFGLPAQMISYEALIENTPKEMTRLLEGLNLEIEEECFQTKSEKNKDLKWNKYWENLDKPVMNSNSGKYKISLSGEEIKIIETRCKDTMKILGYETHTDANWSAPAPSVIDKLYYSKFNKKKPLYKNKEVNAEVNEVLLDRAKVVREIRNLRKQEWKASRS